jgi:hypothetical protein
MIEVDDALAEDQPPPEETEDHRRERRAFWQAPPDEAQTERLQAELEAVAYDVLDGRLQIDNVACRGSRCRWHLTFDSAAEAEVFFALSAERFGPSTRMNLTPDLTPANERDWGVSYEVVASPPRS